MSLVIALEWGSWWGRRVELLGLVDCAFLVGQWEIAAVLGGLVARGSIEGFNVASHHCR